MIKITYKESSIECSTKEEARYVLLVLNEIRKDRAQSSPGLMTRVDVPALLKDHEQKESTRDLERRMFQAKPKTKVC